MYARIIFLIISYVCCALAYPASQKYCATLTPSTSDGISGYFGITIDSVTGEATYGWYIDTSKYTNPNPNTPYNLNNGIGFHIHSFWNNMGTATSGNLATCTAANTGGHYDPGLACGKNSQFQSSPALCGLISRTASSNPPYTYSCNPTNYFAGMFADCEVGDISGKFGSIKPDSSGISAVLGTSLYTDPVAPFALDYGLTGGAGQTPGTPGVDLTTPWNSMVFHASPSGDRIFCAVLVPDTTNSSPCYSGLAFGPIANPDAPVAPTTYSKNQLATGICVSIGLTLLLTAGVMALGWYYSVLHFGKQDKTGADVGFANKDFLSKENRLV